MADDKIIVNVEPKVDEKASKKAKADLESSFDDLGNKLDNSVKKDLESVRNEVKGFAKDFALVGVAAAGVALAVKKAFDLSVEGESIKAINKEFEVLSKQAKLSSENLKESLLSASGGLIDDTSLIQAANRAIIELGNNAKVIPETLEIARKATAVFGGEVVQNFEAINQAIATGNVRRLREIGIIIDQDKALKDFAKTQGVSVDALTEAGKKQAILNAVLEQGAKAFNGVDVDTRKLSNSVSQLKTAFNDLNDFIATSFNNTFSQSIAGAITAASNSIKDFTLSLKKMSGEKLSIDEVSFRLENLKTQLAAFEAGPKIPGVVSIEVQLLRKQVSQTEDELEKLVQAKIKADSRMKSPIDSATSSATAAQNPLFFNQEKVNADREKMLTAIAQNNAQVLAIQQQGQSDEGFALAKASGEKLLILQQYEDQKAQLLLQKKQAQGANEQLFADQLVSIESVKNARILQLEQRASESVMAIRKIVQSNIVNGLTAAFSQLGASLVKGSNGFEAMGKAVVAALGAMAIQIGSLMVATGLSFKALAPVLPIFGISGAAAVIAGLGLIALGGALSASAGGEAGSPSGSGGGAGFGGSGGFAGTGGEVGALAPDLVQREKGTVVNVNIQGNILDRRQTGLEIANIIQEQFDTNGNLIAQGNF